MQSVLVSHILSVYSLADFGCYNLLNFIKLGGKEHIMTVKKMSLICLHRNVMSKCPSRECRMFSSTNRKNGV